jgi:hypothetical protein
MVCTHKYDDKRKIIVNKDIKKKMLSIIVEEFGKVLGFTIEEFLNIHIDLERIANNYEAGDEREKNTFLIKIVQDCHRNLLKSNHNSPFDFKFFKP